MSLGAEDARRTLTDDRGIGGRTDVAEPTFTLSLMLGLKAKPKAFSKHLLVIGTLLFAAQLAFFSVAHAAALPPGTDLRGATARASDGATIVLGPGAYPGVINIKGKSLTIKGDPGGKTVLTGGKSQMIVRIVGNGRLALSHVTFKTRSKDGLAVYVKGGKATITDCRAKATIRPAFYADGGRIEVVRCTLKDLKGSGVVGINKSTIVVRDSVLSGLAKDGIIIRKGSKGEVTGTRFENITLEAVTATDKSSVVVRKSKFSASAGNGVAIIINSTGTVTGSSFDKLGGTAVLGLDGSRVTVEGSSFTGLKETAIHFEGNSRLMVKGSRFEAVKGAVVALKGAGTVSILGNNITNVTGKGYAIVSESSGKVVIGDNRIVKAPNGIQVSGTFKTTAKIANNMLVNVQHHGISLEAKAAGGDVAVKVSGNRIVAAGDIGVFLNKSPKAALTDNLILSKGNFGVFLQHGSSVRLDGNVMAGAKGGLFAHSSAAAGSSAGYDIFIGGMQPKTAVRSRPAGTKIAFLTGGKKTQARLRKLSNAVLAAAGTAPAANLLAKVETAARALLEQAKTIRARAKSLATVALQATDLLGREFSAGYSLYDANGKKVSKDVLNPVTVVPPGTYIIEPDFDTSLARDVTVGAGESKSVKITSKRHLVFLFSSEQFKPPLSRDTIDMPLVLKSRRDMRRALAAYRDSFPVHDIAVMRKSATAKQRNHALALARKALAVMDPKVLALSRQIAPIEKKPYKERTDAENKAVGEVSGKRNTLTAGFVLPAKILAALGDGADAKRLVDEAAKESSLAEQRMAVAAYMENRLGILGTGAVAAALNGKNRDVVLWAAIYLHYFGLDRGDAVLVDHLVKSTDGLLVDRIARTLLDTPGSDVLAAMRNVVDIVLKAQREKKTSGGSPAVFASTRPAAIYLLAHGGAEDYKRVAELLMFSDNVPFMTLVTTDPQPLIDYLRRWMSGWERQFAKYMINQWSDQFAMLCPMFRQLPRRKRARMEKAIERAFVSVGMRFRISGRTPNSDRLSSRSFHSVSVSHCRATGSAASIVYKKNEAFYRSNSWIPTPWATAKLFKSKWYWNNRRLDFVPHADVVKGIKKHHPKDDGKRDMFLAYHAIATNAEIIGRDRLPDGADRRAFILINRANPPGALAAVVSMRPELINDTLRVAVAFDLASHTESSLATMMDPPTRSFERYLASRGKGIIKRLFLRRGDRTIAMTAAKDDGKGNFVFEATLKNRSLSNLDLHVELQIFETIWPLRFGLYASDYARKLNRAAIGLVAAAKAAKARPDDTRALTVWANALQATGRLDEAGAVYEQALALGPKDVNLWFALSDMYAGRGLYDRSVEALRKAVAAVPENSDLRFELANGLYRGGVYSEAADAFGKLSAMEPKEVRWKWWQATNQFLAGDRRAAISFFRGTKTNYQRRRTALLRYIAAKLGGSVEDIAAAEAQMKTQLKGREKTIEGSLYGLYARMIAPPQVFQSARTPAQQCQAHVYVGYGQLVDGKKNEARKRLEAALEVCGANKLEYRLAEAELGRLGKAK